jgi:hypothetical protein
MCPGFRSWGGRPFQVCESRNREGIHGGGVGLFSVAERPFPGTAMAKPTALPGDSLLFQSVAFRSRSARPHRIRAQHESVPPAVTFFIDMRPLDSPLRSFREVFNEQNERLTPTSFREGPRYYTC